jgi:hypothetical protein
MRFDEGDEDVFWTLREGSVEHKTPTDPNAMLSATVRTREVTSFHLS